MGPTLALQTLKLWPREVLRLWHSHYWAASHLKAKMSNQGPCTQNAQIASSGWTTRTQSGILPRHVPEPGSKDIQTTLAGMYQSICYLASTKTSMKSKCLHRTLQQTDIPTKHGQPAPCCKSTCFCGQKLLNFHLLPNRFDGLQRGHQTESGWHLEDQLKKQSLQNKCTSSLSCRAVWKHLPFPPKASWTDGHSGRPAGWAALGAGLSHSHPEGPEPRSCQKRSLFALIWVTGSIFPLGE